MDEETENQKAISEIYCQLLCQFRGGGRGVFAGGVAAGRSAAQDPCGLAAHGDRPAGILRDQFLHQPKTGVSKRSAYGNCVFAVYAPGNPHCGAAAGADLRGVCAVSDR